MSRVFEGIILYSYMRVKEKKIVEYRDTKMKPLLDALEKCFKESIQEQGFLIGSSVSLTHQQSSTCASQPFS